MSVAKQDLFFTWQYLSLFHIRLHRRTRRNNLPRHARGRLATWFQRRLLPPMVRVGKKAG
jgi:hypothetical protein